MAKKKDDGKGTRAAAARRIVEADPEISSKDFAAKLRAEGFTIKDEQASAIRAQAKQAAGIPMKRRGRKAKAAPAAPAEEAPKPSGTRASFPYGANGAADPLEAATAVKEMVRRYGANTVRGLVSLFE